ncbi:MAG: histidine kinase, partial [Candidatus Brocadiia bacterium]
MKSRWKIVVVLGVLIGFLWIFDAAADYYFFYSDATFWELLVFDVPVHELYIRFFVAGTIVACGGYMATLIN